VDITPQQDSLSGVIICPAYLDGQRLRVNSFTVLTQLHIQMRPSVKSFDAVPRKSSIWIALRGVFTDATSV
jgi:hypothetical protein